MVGLRKTNARLLRVVDNKQHATDDDHEDLPVLSSPATEPTSKASVEASMRFTEPKNEEIEDYMRSPVSSGEEVEEVLPVVSSMQKSALAERANDALRPAKRKADDSGSGDEIFGRAASGGVSSSQHKKHKRRTYGSQSSQARSSQAKAKPEFKQAKNVSVQISPLRRPAFKAANNAEVFQSSGTVDLSRSPSLSSPATSRASSPEVLETTGLTTICAICDKDVDVLLKQEYEDQYGHKVNIRRQNAFCRYHTLHEARQTWDEKGYPKVDWKKFEKRLQEHDLRRLRKVIDGTIKSGFRESLAKQVSDRAAPKASTEASAGYYGPRGQKLIIDHIILRLSDALRKAPDSLILTAGISAGLSGYVHRVLMPELAVELIMEDMRVGMVEAKKILMDSKEIGDILNDEEPDVITDPDDDKIS